MSRKDELVAARLLDAYVDHVLNGNVANCEDLLNRCPAAERDALAEAIRGFDAVSEYLFCCHASKNAVQDAISRVNSLVDRQKGLDRAYQLAHPILDKAVTSPRSYLEEILCIKAVSQGTSVSSSQSRDYTMQVWARGEGKLGSTNRTYYDSVARRSFEVRLGNEAEALLGTHDLVSAPVDLHQLVKALMLFVQEVPLENLDGCLVTDGNVGGILINSRVTSRTRKRFTLGHEIAHFVRHRWVRGYFEDNINVLSDSFVDQCEHEANIFASSLLIPGQLLPPDISQRALDFELVDALATQFDVTAEVILRRVISMTDLRCLLVISKDGVVERSIASHWLGFGIRKGFRVHPRSAAGLLSATSGSDQEIMQLPAEAWFERDSLDEGLVVRENSRVAPGGYIHSLINVVEE